MLKDEEDLINYIREKKKQGRANKSPHESTLWKRYRKFIVLQKTYPDRSLLWQRDYKQWLIGIMLRYGRGVANKPFIRAPEYSARGEVLRRNQLDEDLPRERRATVRAEAVR